MDSSGLEVQPKLTIGGAYEFNDVFLDGVVLESSQVIGTVGNGWAVRCPAWRWSVSAWVGTCSSSISSCPTLSPWHPLSSSRRTGVRWLDVRAAIGRCGRTHRRLGRSSTTTSNEPCRGRAPADASIAKVLYSETYNAIARYGAELVTEHFPVPEEVAPEAQRLVDAWLWSRALTISGGSSEVMRNIIAKRRLHLPQ